MTKAKTAEFQEHADSLPPGGLLAQIMAQTRIEPSQEGYAVAERGVAAFVSEMLKSESREQPINKHLVDQMLAAIDRKLSKQMDAILHQPEFQQLESIWRALFDFVQRTDFRENIQVVFVPVTKDELLEDFESAADITRSRRPLRAARVVVQDVDGNPGWYQVALSVRPHFKYMGASFELSLVGRLDKD